MTRDDLIDIISSVTSLLGDALTKYVDLNETIIGQSAGVASQTKKLDLLKARLAGEKLKLSKLKDAAKRRRDLEKANQHKPTANESKTSSGMLTLRDATGKVVGYMRIFKDHTDYFTSTGKLVARYRNLKTYTAGGAYAGNLDQGLRLLGQSLRK